jgi:predicted nuclease of restriction endonuclease-like RecB superfamily
MLTSRLVRVRYSRDRIVPNYIRTDDPVWLDAAERLLELFRGQNGRTRGELEEELKEAFDSGPAAFVYQGLAKLLEDRCEFEVAAGHPPEKLRDAVFRAAARQRQSAEPATLAAARFDRAAVLQEVAGELSLTPEAVEQGLFADLKSEQRLIRFKDISAERLLQRYNVALAQAVLLRSTGVEVEIRGESPQRFRQLFRLVKFHRLVCEAEFKNRDTVHLHLDGPLSLFSATQKYGLQLALFLPAVLACRDFDLRAELRWGSQRKPKRFTLSPDDGLVSHYPERGTYVPPELAMFAELFRKRIENWEISADVSIVRLGDGPTGGFWVPDFRLVHRGSGRAVLLEVLGFWRRSSVERHLQRLRQHVHEPFLLAVSDQLRVDDAELEGLPAGIHRFRQMPLPDEIARLAEAVLAAGP